MILIGLGGNLPSRAGPPARTLNAALAALAKGGANIAALSAYYVTPAWPDPSDPPFVNAVARLMTALPPPALLHLLHETETAFGRIRSTRNAPRTLDLDILDYDGRIETGPPLLPHPRLAARAFVLVPLADVAPAWTHPVTHRTVADLVAGLSETEREAVKPLPSV
ncbi:MAG TPA: 2-amino-4-hydroxy-6-hydroxymethyldihydropteridine diphosphokinase [Rhizomicrobium sp.]